MRFRLSSIACLLCSLLLTASLPAAAQPVTPAAPAAVAPTRQDVRAWHRNLALRYEKTIYLDLSGQPMGVDAFLAVLARRETGVKIITDNPDRNKIITMQLLPVTAQK